MLSNIQKGRTLLVSFLLTFGLLATLGCGAEATPMPAPTGTPVAVAPAEDPAPASPADTAEAVPEDTSDESTSADGTAQRATPESVWSPGTLHPNTVPAPAKLVTAGTLTVGSDVSYPSMEYMDADGNPVGMDIDLAAEIAKRFGLQLKVVNLKVDDLIPALMAGQLDMVISAMTITDERKKVADFIPYLMAGQTILVKKDNPLGIKTLDDLSGKTVIAQQGTKEEKTLNDLNDKLAKEGKPKVNVMIYPSDIAAVDQLLEGKADATFHDMPLAAYYVKVHEADLGIAVPNFDPALEGIAIAQDNKPMSDAVNAAITSMKGDGTFDTIRGKWGVCEELEYPKPESESEN